MMDAPRRTTIMVVDDEPDNLNVLENVLDAAGYAVVAFPRGAAALRAAQEQPPALALLDVRMPEMDGLQLCRSFKLDIRLSGIPVIFLSALQEEDDILAGFEAGGADYVTKPFHEPEVLARIRVQLRLRSLQHELSAHSERLEATVAERTRRLIEAHRQLAIWDEAKNDWLNVIAHELRTPMNGVLGVADLLVADLKPDSPLHACAEVYREARTRIMRLIEDADLLIHMRIGREPVPCTPLALGEVLAHARELADGRLNGVSVEGPAEPQDSVSLLGHADLLQRAFADLLWTAFCCTTDDSQPIRISVHTAGSQALVGLHVAAPPLPPEAISTFFELCGQRDLRRPAGDFGLAPILARTILLLCGGDVRLLCDAGNQLLIQVCLPLADGGRSRLDASAQDRYDAHWSNA